MPAYLFLGVVLLVGIVLLVRWAVDADPAILARILKLAGAALGVVGVLLLVWRSPLGLLPLAFAGAAFYLLRRSGAPRRPGRRPRILETAMLSLSIEPEGGPIDGTMRQGRYRGSRLRRLTLAQLLDLMEECRREDPDSAAALEAFLDRTYGAAWHDEPARGRRGRTRGSRRAAMSRAEALAVLGLDPQASPDEIAAAHRRLMQKVHPDHGGSSYLAARINQARDVLIGE
ncbi:MAG: molecular chaperone DnaJ [Rhodospirillaceae bacterium]|nr:molecular chaperone DnaJ [Rhodospirillaceae bacterium]